MTLNSPKHIKNTTFHMLEIFQLLKYFTVLSDLGQVVRCIYLYHDPRTDGCLLELMFFLFHGFR